MTTCLGHRGRARGCRHSRGQPLPFLQAVHSALIAKGIRAKDIQYEVFGPDLWLADFQ
ncbi:MAG: hypothetical protein NVS2B15_16150 [Pseudarthrobacter sp.]